MMIPFLDGKDEHKLKMHLTYRAPEQQHTHANYRELIADTQFDNVDCSTCGCTGTWIAEHNAFCCGSCGDVYEATDHDVLQSQINRYYTEINVAGKLEKQHPDYENGECVTCGEVGIWIAEQGAFCCLACGDSYRANKDEIVRDQIRRSFHSRVEMKKKCENDNVECLTCGGNGIWVAEHEAFICDSCGDVYEASEHEVLQIQVQAFNRREESRKLKHAIAHESVDCTTCGEIGIWIAQHGVFCCQTCGECCDVTAAEIMKCQISKSFHNMMASPHRYSDYENAACSTCGCIGTWVAEHEQFCCGLCGDAYEETWPEILQSHIQAFNRNNREVLKINRNDPPDYDSAECISCGQTGIWIAEHGIFSCGSCGDCYGASKQDIRLNRIQKFFERKLSQFRPVNHHDCGPPFNTDTASSATRDISPCCHLSLNKIILNPVRTSKRSGVQQICPLVLNYPICDTSSVADSSPNQSSPIIPRSLEHNLWESFTPEMEIVSLEQEIDFLEKQARRLGNVIKELEQQHEVRTADTRKKNTRSKKVHARYKKCENVYIQWLGSVTTITSPVRSASELVCAAKKLHHNINRGYVVGIPEYVIKSLNDAIRLRKKVSKDRGHLHWLRALQQCRSHLIQSQKVLQQKRNENPIQNQKVKRRQRRKFYPKTKV